MSKTDWRAWHAVSDMPCNFCMRRRGWIDADGVFHARFVVCDGCARHFMERGTKHPRGKRLGFNDMHDGKNRGILFFDVIVRGVGGRLRFLTERELARCQGFPDSFAFLGSKSAIHRQIGNSVAVPVIAAIALAIRHQLARAEPRPRIETPKAPDGTPAQE